VTSCGSIALTVTERKFILTFLGSLDDVIEQAASQAHFYYLGSMVSALAASHLQLCDPANQGGYGINFVSPESVAGLPDQRFNPGNWQTMDAQRRGAELLSQSEAAETAQPAGGEAEPEPVPFRGIDRLRLATTGCLSTAAEF
jgi:hypothetical protein